MTFAKPLTLLVCLATLFALASCQPQESLKDTAVQTKWMPKEDQPNNSIKVEPPPATSKADLTPPAAEARKENQTMAKPQPTMEKTNAKNNAQDKGTFLESTYTVQAGAFQNPVYAAKLKEKLEAKGYPVFLQPFSDSNGTKWTTVRIGTYHTRQDAVAEAQKFARAERMKFAVISGSRIQKVVVFSEQTIPHEAPKLTKKEMKAEGKRPQGQEAFQVGGLFEAANAKKLMDRLKSMGYAPFLHKIKDQTTNETWYSVRIGFFHSKEEAGLAGDEFSVKENLFTSVPMD